MLCLQTHLSDRHSDHHCRSHRKWVTSDTNLLVRQTETETETARQNAIDNATKETEKGKNDCVMCVKAV